MTAHYFTPEVRRPGRSGRHERILPGEDGHGPDLQHLKWRRSSPWRTDTRIPVGVFAFPSVDDHKGAGDAAVWLLRLGSAEGKPPAGAGRGVHHHHALGAHGAGAAGAWTAAGTAVERYLLFAPHHHSSTRICTPWPRPRPACTSMGRRCRTSTPPWKPTCNYYCSRLRRPPSWCGACNCLHLAWGEGIQHAHRWGVLVGDPRIHRAH